jgi:MFS family permease
MSRFMDASSNGWRHIYRFVAWHLMSQIGFSSAIWILYLQHRGYSLTQIGIAEAVFHLAPILLEVPSGSFADLIGRRWALAVSSTLVFLSSLFMLSAATLPIVLIGMFLLGASFSFRSGADQAFLFDALTADQRSRYGRVFGRLLSAGYVIAGASTWIGAWLSERSYAIPYSLSAITALCGIALAFGLTEPGRERDHSTERGIRSHARQVRTVLRERPAVALMLLTAAVFWVMVTITDLYVQAVFSERGLSNGQIGLLIGTMFLAIAAGTSVGGHLGRGFTWQWPVLAILTGVGIILVGVEILAIAIGAYIVSQFITGIVETRMSGWYNAQLPTNQRATVLSIESWLFSCFMIVLFPLAGWLAGRAGWSVLYAVCGAIAMLTALAVFVLRRHPETAGEGSGAGNVLA